MRSGTPDDKDKRNIKDLDPAGLRMVLVEAGQPAFRARQVFSWLFARGIRSFEDMSDLDRPLRGWLGERFFISWPEEVERRRGRDGAEKFVLRLADGRLIETVHIPAPGRSTVCVSVQVGCRFGCPMCASGAPGYTRDLSAAEIVDQVLFVRGQADRPVTHVVFMGMGEPLDNWDQTARAIRLLNARDGLGIAARRITISTCGLVPGLEKLRGLGLQVELAVSLHAATNELRDKLVPVNRKYPLEQLIPALRAFSREAGRKITLEYALIRGVNDSPGDAEALARLAGRLGAKVNLIPCSPVEGSPFLPGSAREAAEFLKRLDSHRVRAVLRRSKGGEIQAACGQLAGRPRSRTP